MIPGLRSNSRFFVDYHILWRILIKKGCVGSTSEDVHFVFVVNSSMKRSLRRNITSRNNPLSLHNLKIILKHIIKSDLPKINTPKNVHRIVIYNGLMPIPRGYLPIVNDECEGVVILEIYLSEIVEGMHSIPTTEDI